jgi:hypothetical protein
MPWSFEIHLEDMLHRQIIVLKLHNQHPQGLLSVSTDYVDYYTYDASGLAYTPGPTRLLLTLPVGYYLTSAYQR